MCPKRPEEEGHMEAYRKFQKIGQLIYEFLAQEMRKNASGLCPLESPFNCDWNFW